ncbi:hypothetical protein R3P38DRAFT_3244631 [Favolaschia claudopus]|uniref:Uncharacterized protein n=1 Tax=Favolaschia claudopus TaxID=2862362 RepID=A0AAV9Z381_9AGAR
MEPVAAPADAPAAAADAAPAAASVGETGQANADKNETAGDPADMKRALCYNVDSTNVISGLPPIQKDRVVKGWRRRHLEQEDPERANAEDDDEVYARTGTSYDISCYTLMQAHAEAVYRAEQRAKEWEYHTDSDDDGMFEEEDLKLEDIIIWDGTRPGQFATDAGIAADKAIAKAATDVDAEEVRTGKKYAVSAMISNADKPFFHFVPASILMAAADADVDLAEEEDADSLYGVERSPILGNSPMPSLEPASPSTIPDLELGERMADVEMPAAKASDARVGGEAGAAEGSAAPAPAMHVVQLVNIGGVRKVECKCVDGKHGELRSRKSYAFEALDGTVVVKKFRTMIVALN